MIAFFRGLTEPTLKHSILGAIAASMALASAGTPSHAQEAVKSTISKASAVHDKTVNAVKRGVDKNGSAVQHAGRKTSEAIQRGADKIGVPSRPVSSPGAPTTSPQR
jgi:hypothetical protein